MQITSRFSIAILAMGCIHYFGKDGSRVTSHLISSSTGVNPVIVRGVIAQLRDAGIIRTQQGSGGAKIAKPLESITLYDIYKAVDSVDDRGLFRFHENPNPLCPVGRNIYNAVDDVFGDIECALENRLKSVKLSQIIDDLESKFICESKGD